MPALHVQIADHVCIDDDHGRPICFAVRNSLSVMGWSLVFWRSRRARSRRISALTFRPRTARSMQVRISLLMLRRLAAADCFSSSYNSVGIFFTVIVGIEALPSGCYMEPLWLREE